MTTLWRPLSDDEALRWPMARLGGALAVVTVCAGVLSAAAFVGLIVVIYRFGLFGLGAALLASRADTLSVAAKVGAIYAVPSIALLLWGVVLLAMTLARTAATPVVASALFSLHYVLGIAAGIAGQITILGQSDGATASMLAISLVSYAPAWLAGLMLTAGFCGYFLGGVRANAYFRRRVAVGPEA